MDLINSPSPGDEYLYQIPFTRVGEVFLIERTFVFYVGAVGNRPPLFLTPRNLGGEKERMKQHDLLCRMLLAPFSKKII